MLRTAAFGHRFVLTFGVYAVVIITFWGIISLQKIIEASVVIHLDNWNKQRVTFSEIFSYEFPESFCEPQFGNPAEVPLCIECAERAYLRHVKSAEQRVGTPAYIDHILPHTLAV
jgi:hypothetical protein